ncbi:MAG: hypothetical protein Q9194_006457 [Teloschistes cf. exilis]
MPYTPPANRSPAVSEPNTPRYAGPKSSGNQQQENGVSAHFTLKTSLPCSSSSYLNRERRSPSLTKPNHEDRGNQEKGDESTAIDNDSSPSSSSHSPSDDEDSRGRRSGQDPKLLAELQAAITLIEQHRESSPERVSEERLKARATLGLEPPRVDPQAKEHAANPENQAPLPLSEAARKISHSRSNTEMSALLDIPRAGADTPNRSASETDMDELDDDDWRTRPTPIRKKSGELVKPVLSKGGLRRRPLSMPGTPTYQKAVHFDSTSLENVRTFSGDDRPIVVSAGTSPAEQYADDIEFPFGDDPSKRREPVDEWVIHLSNFPRETYDRKWMPVRVERVYLSSDNKSLLGAIVVANLAFHKTVVARFTLDFWVTTSEVVADYNNDVRRKQLNDGCDRFLFSIKLADQANLENKTMFFCVRYNVNGQEFWDNNGSINYRVDFAKKPKDTKRDTQGANVPLPRSKPSHSASSVRPHSYPSGMDDFGSFDSSFGLPNSQPPPSQIIGDCPIRFRRHKPANEIVADAPAQRSNGSSQAFGERYNIAHSLALSNALVAVSPSLGERGDPEYRNAIKSAPAQQMSFAKQPMVGSGSKPPTEEASGKAAASKSGNPSMLAAKPAALTSEKGYDSKDYKDLLANYCFGFESKPSQKARVTAAPKSQPPAQFDGAVDEPAPSKAEWNGAPANTQSKTQPVEENTTPSRVTSPKLSHAHSPTMSAGHGSRPTSPLSFGHPCSQAMQNGLFAESHTPTAILG